MRFPLAHVLLVLERAFLQKVNFSAKMVEHIEY
jgi:hypothetical protein